MATTIKASMLLFPSQVISKKKSICLIKCQDRKEECHSLRKSLLEAKNGKKFVICVRNPTAKGFIVEDFYLLQALGMAVPKLMGMSFCKILHLELDHHSFEQTYELMKNEHVYDPKKWKAALGIRWKRYDACDWVNYEYFKKGVVQLEDLNQRFSVARDPLYIPKEETSCNAFTDLIFVDEEIENLNIKYLSQVVNPKAFMLKENSNIDHIIHLCEMMNLKQEGDTPVIVVKMSPSMFINLGGYMRKLRKEGISATWLVDPVIAVEEETSVLTRKLYDTTALVEQLKGIFSREGENLGGLYLHTTTEDIRECRMFEDTKLPYKARLHLEQAFYILECFANGPVMFAYRFN